jgi:Uma2 family endonuclease
VAKDLGLKRRVYAEAGIVEYWVVNLAEIQLIVFRGAIAGEYETELTLTTGTISPLAFLDIKIEIIQLFKLQE